VALLLSLQITSARNELRFGRQHDDVPQIGVQLFFSLALARVAPPHFVSVQQPMTLSLAAAFVMSSQKRSSSCGTAAAAEETDKNYSAAVDA
jgi:hypothetical protein